jgi:hypothetical protein
MFCDIADLEVNLRHLFCQKQGGDYLQHPVGIYSNELKIKVKKIKSPLNLGNKYSSMTKYTTV